MRVGLIGTGAISHMHAQAYKNIGFEVVACTDIHAAAGEAFAAKWGGDFVKTWEEVCRHPKVDYVDVCTFPDFRLQPLELCAENKKHIQVQKPIATSVATARAMVEKARAAYVKWFRSAGYYSRPIKGSWATEGGGALINQAIHQVDVLLWLIGRVKHVWGEWQLGALHKIESEDVLTAGLRYASDATGVIQASTAFWPGYTERLEIHGTRGTAIISGDKLTTWDVEGDSAASETDPAPVDRNVASGASDPMAISLAPFERQFLDLGEAIRTGRKPLVGGEEGRDALELVDAIYRSCREGVKVSIA
jgi:predicted dehydrogenase